jgi:hypothetical protein
MRIRPVTKIVFGFIGTLGLWYGGTYGYTKMTLAKTDLHPIESSDLCLLAISPEAGVKVIAAEQMVQVVEASGGFHGEESGGGGAESGSVKKRIPVRELVGMLGGDADSAQSFVRKMRDATDESELSDSAPLWTRDDILKAIAGDKALKGKLERDLNVTLDGKPLPILNLVAYFYGIRIKTPITVKVPNAKGAAINSFDIVSFKTRAMTQFYKEMQARFVDKKQLQQFYDSFLKDNPSSIQDIAETIKAVCARSVASAELQKVEHIGSHSTILVNQSMINSVDMVEQSDGKVTTYDLKLKLSSEGKNRLWKFSSEGGTQILVISKGVAIAAATIGTQLNSEELAIKQIADRRLVEEAVNLVHSK